MAQSNTLYSRLPEGYHSWLQQRLYGHPFLTLSDVEKQMRLESGGNPTAKSNQGAMGLFQQLPGTFASMGVGNDINDPYQNTEAYLKYMEEGYNNEGSKEGAYGHYFAGPDHKQWGPKTAAYQQHMMGGEPMSGGEMMAQGMNSLQEMPDNQEYMAGALTLDQMNTEQGVNDIIDSVMGNRDPMQAMFAGMANSKAPAYSGGLQQVAAMFGSGVAAANLYERDSNNMRIDMAMMRLNSYERQEDRTARANQDKAPASVKEFQHAMAGGYEGTYVDFLQAKKQSITVNTGNQGGVSGIISPEDKTSLGLDPDSPYVWAKDGTPKAVKPSAFTEGQLQATSFHEMMSEADKVMDGLTDKGFDSTNLYEYAANEIPIIGNYLQRPEAREWRQAQEQWVRAKLRKESGAVIGVDEMDDEIKTYFPMPGDDKTVIARKREARRDALSGMQTMTGGKVKESQPQERETSPDSYTQDEINEFEKMIQEGY